MLALPLKRSDNLLFQTKLEHFLNLKFSSNSSNSSSSSSNTSNTFLNSSNSSLSSNLTNLTSKYSSDILFLQQLRDLAISSTITTEQIGIQNLLHYNYHLKTLSKKFLSYENDINLNFIWTDAFRPNFRCTSNSFYFDWGCILWNMAAIESHRGSIIERSTDEGIRSASIQFQLAAGILEYIRTEISPKINSPKSPELQELFIRMVIQLLLAQAQICFYEKAIRDRKNTGNMKPSLIAKLAQQVVTFYASALDICREREISMAIDQSWLFHMEFQRESFRAVSEYWQSVASKDEALQRGVGYGEEITRLRKAEEIMSQVVQYGRSRGISLQAVSTAESVLITIQKAKTIAEKDNSTIYHDTIPDYAILNSVAGVAMVKPSSLPEYYSNDKPLFADILPKGTYEIMSLYKEKSQTLLQEVEKKSIAATDECRSALSAIGLPASLEILKTGGELPEGLWKKIEQVQQMGGIQELLRKLEDVENLAERARNTIDGIENSLKREDNLDKAFRQRYPDYQQPPSSQLNRDIQATTKLMLQAHETGRSNDTTLSIQLNQSQFLELMRLLGLSRHEISDLLPRTGKDKAFSYDTQKLEAHLLAIAQLIESRNQIVETFKAKIPNETIVCDHLLEKMTSFNGAIGEDIKLQWVQAELDILNPEIKALEDSYIKQGELLQQVYQENILFNNARENDPSNIERDRILKSLEQGVSSFFGYQSQLNAGGVFYRDMQSRLTTLMQQCDDLSYTQQLQRQDYEAEKMRSQDRVNQEMRDHELAMKLAAELERSNLAASQPQNVPPQPTSQQNLQGSFLYPTAPQHSSAPYGAPIQHAQPVQQQQQQLPPGPPNPYNVVYGQPINGPPPTNSYNPPPSLPQAQVQTQPTTPYLYNSLPSVPPQQPQVQTTNYNPYEPTIVRSSTNPDPNYSTSSAYPPISNYSYQPHTVPQQQPQPQQQQYSNPSYPTLPGASSYAPPQQQPMMPNSQGGVTSGASSPEFNAKVQRLIEMGFDRNSVINSLNANNGDEMAALNGLLSGAPPSPSTVTNNQSTAPSSAPPVQQSQPQTQSSGGMFGRLWGK